MQNSENSQLDAEQLGGNRDQWRAKVCEKRWQIFYQCLWKSLKNTLVGIEHLAHALENNHLWLRLIIDFKLEMVTNTDVLQLIIAIVSLTNPTGSNLFDFLFFTMMTMFTLITIIIIVFCIKSKSFISWSDSKPNYGTDYYEHRLNSETLKNDRDFFFEELMHSNFAPLMGESTK